MPVDWHSFSFLFLATVLVLQDGLRFRTGDTVHLQSVIGLECFNSSFGFRSVDSVHFPAGIAKVVQAGLNPGEFLYRIQMTRCQIPLRWGLHLTVGPNFQ